MDKSVVILGNGGHARVTASLVHALGLTLLGVTAPSTLEEQENKALPIIGDDGVVFEFEPDSLGLINGLGTPENNTRARILLYHRFLEANYHFPTLVHPQAAVDHTAKIGLATQIHLRAIVQPFVNIEDNVIINTAAIIEHDVHIQSHCHIAPNATVLGGVKIGEGVLVGASATILPGCKIGDYAIIGAGAVVTKNVLPHTTVMGIPAKVCSLNPDCKV